MEDLSQDDLVDTDASRVAATAAVRPADLRQRSPDDQAAWPLVNGRRAVERARAAQP